MAGDLLSPPFALPQIIRRKKKRRTFFAKKRDGRREMCYNKLWTFF